MREAIFDHNDIESALDAARKCHKATEKVIRNVNEWRSEEGT